MGGRAQNRGRDREALGYGLPKTYEDLRAVLASGSVRLPKRLRQVAVYLWQHPSEVALGTVTSVAENAGVQPSTMVRFAQNLGYSGFSDLQDVFKSYVKESWPEPRERLSVADGGRAINDPNFHLVAGLVDASVQSLLRVTESVDRARFAAVVKALARANAIYLVGSKRAFPVTMYMSLALSQLGIGNILVDNVGSTAFGQIGCTTKRDAVLAVSFSPYNSITPELAATAAQRGTPLLSITDSAFSPLVPLSDAWIEVMESEFGGFRSMAATIAVGMAVVLAVAKARQSSGK
jgi:DNA-binding MurR/RpiR family transcriptional regulator